MQRTTLDLREVKTIDARESQIEELRLVPGDVLFNEGGDRDKLGRGWIWRGELTECIHQNHVFRARLYTADLVPEILSWYGNMNGQRYFFDEGKQTTNLASINMTNLKNHFELDRDQKKHLRFEALRGVELVPNVSRLCGMNLYLHGIGPSGREDYAPPIRTDDALRDEPDTHAEVVITNPPFGKKSSITVVNEEGETDRQSLTYNRPDFWTTTSNKQLNFVQHVKSLLAIHGRAAVVVPDNVLFEGGAGETVRKNLLKECEVHTLLRLPTGIFYAQGVKANVLFFDRKPGAKEPWTKTVWVYDLRTNKHFTLKTRRLARADLDEFVECYRPGSRQKRKATWSEKTPEGRWRPYVYDEIVARDKVSLDIFWLRDESLEDSDSLPEPHVLAQEIADDLRAALSQIEDVLGDLEQRVLNE